MALLSIVLISAQGCTPDQGPGAQYEPLDQWSIVECDLDSSANVSVLVERDETSPQPIEAQVLVGVYDGSTFLEWAVLQGLVDERKTLSAGENVRLESKPSEVRCELTQVLVWHELVD
jgi:hypothetical protein